MVAEMTISPTSALADLHASAATPDHRAFATISGRTHVQLSLAPGYYEWASVADLERQLTRLAKLLFVSRMKAYYAARSRDFGQTFTHESPPTSPRDEEYVRARSGLVVEVCDHKSVAEVSAAVSMPIGVVRVLLGDLVEQGYVGVQATLNDSSSHDERLDLIERTLRGLRAF
jgi:hypothetical protein